MRYANRALFIPIPRWRCPALIKDYWRRLRRVSLLYQRSARGARRTNAGDYPFNGRRRYRYRRGGENKLFVFGNAPTALFRLLEHNVTVSGVVGVPVGFVGAAESKEALTHSHFPAVAALGRKGGSNVAAAIVNALLYHLREA